MATEYTEFLRLKIKFQGKKTVSIRVHPCQNKERRDYDATTGRYEYSSSAEPDCDLEELFAEQQRSPLEIIRCCEQICKQLLSEGRRRCAKVDLAELRQDCEYWEEDV